MEAYISNPNPKPVSKCSKVTKSKLKDNPSETANQSFLSLLPPAFSMEVFSWAPVGGVFLPTSGLLLPDWDRFLFKINS